MSSGDVLKGALVHCSSNTLVMVLRNVEQSRDALEKIIRNRNWDNLTQQDMFRLARIQAIEVQSVIQDILKERRWNAT